MSEETVIQLALTILALPFLSFLLLLSLGRILPRKGDWLATGILTVALGFSLVVMFGVLGMPVREAIPGFSQAPIQVSGTWIDLKTTVSVLGAELPLRIDLGIMVDNVTAIMLVVVTLITTLVHLFSIGYMEGDPKYHRYFAYLGLFGFSMLGIVLTNNLLMMYIFWELVGVSSYLLIGFWYENPGPAYASKKAFIVNRIGDIGMFLGILIMFTSYGSFRFDTIFWFIGGGELPFGSEAWLTAGGILLFCGAVGKSAQFPLHTWLPDAMEGPTPVSALIHAATMVAAGVYLVARIFPLMTAEALTVVAVIGAVTAFLAATIALVQNDIKKVLAYSTISQLGYMIFAVGLGAYTAALFHLATHAMFKALLFLGSGSVIHAMHHSLHHLRDHETDPQDIRNMGGLGKKMPVTFITFVIASLSISGIPLFSGFLSKDEILASAWAFGSLKGGFAVLFPYIGYGVAALTAFYMFRLVFLTFTGNPKRGDIFEHVKESGWNMKLPLVILAALSTWIFFSWNPFGPSSGWFMQSVQTPQTVVGDSWYVFGAKTGHVAEEAVSTAGAMGVEMQELLEHTVHEVHTAGMLVSLVLALSGILVAFLFYTKKVVDVDALERRYKSLHRFLLNKWYFDELYEKWVVVPGILLLTRILNWFDGNIVDGAVNGAAKVTVVISRISGWIDKYIVDGLVNFSAYFAGFAGLVVRKLQTGKIQTYVALVLLGVVVLFYAFY